VRLTRASNAATCAVLSGIAALLLAGTSDAGHAAAVGSRHAAADQASLDLYPASTKLSRAADTEADVYVPAGTEMAKLVMFLPAGYGLDLTKPPGTKVGAVFAWDSAGFPTLGDVVSADPAAYTTNSCVPGLHQAVWILGSDDSIRFPATPVFVDQTTGADTELGAYKAQACLASSSTGSMQIRLLALDLKFLTNPAATGVYTWRLFVTPYAGGVPNDGGTFEIRSTLPLPSQLTLYGHYDRRHKRALLDGRLIAPAYDTAGVYLDLYMSRGGRLRYSGSVRTHAQGRYSFRRRITKTTQFAMTTATWDDCTGSPAPGGCISDTLATIQSRTVKVAVRKRAKH
jgi:hypothetical protein